MMIKQVMNIGPHLLWATPVQQMIDTSLRHFKYLWRVKITLTGWTSVPQVINSSVCRRTMIQKNQVTNTQKLTILRRKMKSSSSLRASNNIYLLINIQKLTFHFQSIPRDSVNFLQTKPTNAMERSSPLEHLENMSTWKSWCEVLI